MNIKERLAKDKAIIQAYNNIELESGNEREHLQPKLLEDNWMRFIRMNDVSRVPKVETEQERGAVFISMFISVFENCIFYSYKFLCRK